MAQSVKISYFEVVFCLGQKILSDRQRWDVQSCFEGATCCWITGKKIIDFFPRSLRRKHHVSRMGPKTLNDPTHASLPCSIITATVTIFCLPNVSGSMLVLGGLGRPTWRGAGLRFWSGVQLELCPSGLVFLLDVWRLFWWKSLWTGSQLCCIQWHHGTFLCEWGLSEGRGRKWACLLNCPPSK